MSDLTISGSESAVNLTNPNVQVPAPPIPQTVEDLETQLSEVEALYKDILKGFGNTTMVQYKNQQQYDSAKANAYELYKKTIPAQIKKRKAWENKYSLRQAQLLGPDYVVLTAQEVYDIQQKYKAATNPNDKELKAYDDAVAEARSIEERISTPGTYEAGLSPSEQQLLIATAYKKVASKITPRVQEFRSDDIPIIVDEYGRTTKSTQFFVAPRVQQTIDTSVDRAIAEADKEFSSSVPDQVDKYGRVLTTTSVRDQEQSRKFAQFTDRANALRAATPEQAARLAPQQPKTAAQELRGGVQDVVPAPVSKTTPATTTGTAAKVTPTVTVTPRTTATTSAPPGVRGGMVVNQTPVTLPSTTTPSTGPGATGTGGNGVRAKRQPVSPDAWKDLLRQTFPSYSNDWLTDNAVAHFGQDVISLMIEAADPKGRFGGLKTDEGKAAYDKALRQTSYFLNTETAARTFDQATPANQQALINQKKLEITADLGDVGLDETTLNRVASEAARKGLTGLGLSQAVYANILKPSGAPSPVATRALEAADADRIRKIGRAYNYNVTDDEIKSILTGVPTPAGIVLTEDGLREKAQKYAKGVMPQLADQIDSGLTLDEISGNYRRYAAQLLEQSEDQIDMFSGPYLQAFGTKDTGQLSLGDWVERVKSDSRFGWQYTKQANQQATDVALSIARAFGKVQ